MPTSLPVHRLGACAVVMALVIASACARDVSTLTVPNASQQPVLSAADAQAMSEAVSADADGEFEGITALGTPFDAIGFAGALGMSDRGACMPTISPSPVVNSDSDRVPDSVRVTFAGCAFADGSEADTIRGSIDIIDPTPTVTDRDLRIVFTDFARVEVEDGRERSLVLNGAREATRDSSVISQTETNFKTLYTFADGRTSTHTRNWAVLFTADVKGSIHPDSPLPSGTLSVNGTSTWTRDTSTYALMVSTNPVLHRNASCTVRPKFDSGTLHVAVTRRGVTSNVTVQFTACGQYTVTRS